MASGGGGNIKVVVRVRPFNGREIDRKAKCVVQMKAAQTVITPPNAVDTRFKNAKAVEGSKTFAFDRSYWSFNRDDSNFAGQDNLFFDLGQPLLDNAFKGYNNCIFAYGQTGSGKSYSMMGYGEEAGVIPRICRRMFETIDELQLDKNLSCTVEVSYLEIYNERVRDLLNPATKGNLKVREHPSTGPYVEDLAKLVVRSFVEIENLMDEGNKARTVAATNMNETSSRSHAVFTLTLTQKRYDTETSMDTEKVAKISLVDLAGSERATSTGATGARLKEGAEINRSLSTLGRVIAALADLSTGKKKNASMVPYRDSVLTWLLKDSLGGNSMTAMIAAISPADINFEETLSTLRYADSAKRIKNHAVVNEDPNARMIRELKEELAQLRSKLTGGGGAGVGGAGLAADEQYAPGTPLEKQFVSFTSADGTVKKVSKAEIAEQLNQSEKLYQDLNQTWEEKLHKTEQIHKEREAALEELGISIEKGFIGMSTPKKMPHLVNLSDDPLLAECLVYNLKPGTTMVGNVDTATTAEIRLNGSKILHEHCTFDNVDGVVTVVPREGASVMVNGQRIERPKRLRSGYRVILGDFHIFRFNHPQEARAERAEQGGTTSLLRHSITAAQLGSPSPRPQGHERTWSSASRPDSEADIESPRAASPLPTQGHGRGRDSDWSMARREAVTAVLGADQKISALTDDELDILFDDLQKVRAGRGKAGRPESRLFNQGAETEDDMDSVTSYPVREKYASTGTIDSFSVDTALTMPSTPQPGEEDDRLRSAREDLQGQLERQKEEFQAQLKAQEEAHVEMEEIRAEKQRMEENLRVAKEDMQRQLQTQKEEFERQISQLTTQQPMTPPPSSSQPPDGVGGFSEAQLELVRGALAHWRRHRYVAMAETVLQNAATLKEAQIMSQQMDKHVVFQFCVVDVGHTFVSSYDLVLNGVSAEDDDDLLVAPTPGVGVRVVDFKNRIVHLWSLAKLRRRVRQMRQMHQYLHRPEYLQHFRLENPFSEPCLPEYSRIGDADIPLAAVFESRVQDFALDVISPYSFSVVGIVRLSLEPSSAEAPSSTLKFNVVMHDLVGFPEREGSEVHGQLFVPGIIEDGATTTQIIRDFDEGPVRFESVHSMSLPFSSPHTASLRVSIFARVTPMHLDKLLSWDDMRDAAARGPRKKQRRTPRLPESEFYTEETYDIFTRVQVHEISEEGGYRPVEVVQTGALDSGAHQLHQGLQRRVVVHLTHSSGDALRWRDVSALRVGRVHLVDPQGGRITDLDPAQPDVPLALVAPPAVRDHADGTTHVTLVGQWDSSMHDSLLLDRPTADRHRVGLTLAWEVACDRLAAPMPFALELAVQMRGRAWIRPSSVFRSLWRGALGETRVRRSTTGAFVVALRPTAAKRAADLWRMDTQADYVRGEEYLAGWTPRGVSLVRDFLAARRRRRRVDEIETAHSVLGRRALQMNGDGDKEEADATAGAETNGDGSNADTKINGVSDGSLGTTYNDHQTRLLHKVLSLWTTDRHATEAILVRENVEPPARGAAFARGASDASNASLPSTTNGTAPPSRPTLSPSPDSRALSISTTASASTPAKPTLVASVRFVPKNPHVLKAGALLTPDDSATRWVRRHVELRPPYLHVHAVPDPATGAGADELNAINLTHARVDHRPPVAKLLRTGPASPLVRTPRSAHGDEEDDDGGGDPRVWAVFGKENAYLFLARSEREKIEWILKIDQSYFSEGGGGGSASVSGSE